MAHTKRTARIGKRGGGKPAAKPAPPAPTGATPAATPAPGGGAPLNAGGHPSVGRKCPRKHLVKKLLDPKVHLWHLQFVTPPFWLMCIEQNGTLFDICDLLHLHSNSCVLNRMVLFSTFATCFTSILTAVYWTEWYSFLTFATCFISILCDKDVLILQAPNPGGKEPWYSMQQARRWAISRQAGKTDHLIPKLPFARLVREIANDIKMELRFQANALAALHEAA